MQAQTNTHTNTHTQHRFYREWEREHFPDPQGLRLLLERMTLGLYPGVLKAAMAVFDVPEAIAVTRTAMCAVQGSLTTISRLQVCFVCLCFCMHLLC